MEISEAQRQAWANKVAQGFNTTDIPLEFALLTSEIGEAFTAWRKQLPDFGEELADIAIYLMGLAEITNINLEAEIAAKLDKNTKRTYQKNAQGVPIRTIETS